MRTTHVGSLPRPEALTTLLLARDAGGDAEGLEAAVEEAVADVVRRQRAVGLDIINDGEQGKASYASYVRHRLSGFAGAPSTHGRDDREDFPEFWAQAPRLPGASNTFFPSCNGPIRAIDAGAAESDVARLQRAAVSAGSGAGELFISAASPGLIAGVFGDEYYGDREAFLGAIVEAMREEYRVIVGAGMILQLDCPDLAGSYSWSYKTKGVAEFRSDVAQSLEALDAAVAGLPPERLRIHVCWGNNESPHVHDLPLAEIIDLLLGARPAGLSFEAANPRHAHEWRLFEEVRIPDGKYLIPGVIDTTTNFVEHPELVAQRLVNYGRAVGEERVVGGCDCGFATFAGPRRVERSVAWAKLESLAEGAALATKVLRRRGD